MSSRDRSIRDRIAQNDVTVARSYLEVDFMEWFSANQIPFGYEAFTIPSVVSASQSEWSTMVDAIQAIGQGDDSRYRSLVAGTRFESKSAFEVQNMWQRIYDKHALQSEDVVVPVTESLSRFDKRLILPDFAIYPNAGTSIADEDFDWSAWEYIVEVSGLWGVGLPDESTETDWWSWYRVSAVAFKELVYKMLDLWDDVYYLIPNQPYIPGVADGIPNALRDDPHYIIFNTTQAKPELGELYTALGFTAANVSDFETRLSPPVDLIEYSRPIDEGLVRPIRWDYDGIDLAQADENENVVVVDEEWLVYYGEMGEVYVNNESVHVKESQWKRENMILVREYVLNVLADMADDGIVGGLSRP